MERAPAGRILDGKFLEYVPMDSTRPLRALCSVTLVGGSRLARLFVLGGLAAALTACGGGGGGGGGGGDAPNVAPTANFSATPSSGRFPLTVAFNGSASTDSDGTIATYAWDFGDSTPAGSGATVSHVYAAAGTYTARLTVTDNRGATGTRTTTITVQGNASPTASFTAAPINGRAPLLVSFDAAASTDSDGTITSYQWNFGNGNTATGVTAQQNYVAAGTFTVQLTVTDNDGATASTTRTVTVAPPFGVLAVTVKDPNGFAVPEAQVVVDVGGLTRTGRTNDTGQLTFNDVVSGTGNLTVSRETFKTKTQAVTVEPGATTNVNVELERETRAIGGVLTTRVTANPDPQTVEFEVTVVVVNEQSNAITGLPSTAFKLEACAPNAGTSSADCVAGLSPAQLDLDAAYTPDPAGGAPLAGSFVEQPGGAAQPYAAALLFDQSSSITGSDPTDARLFSAREFLGGLGSEDRAGLAAFASNGAGSNLAKIPDPPVTIYPVGSPVFVADGALFYPTLDELATQEGGRTPLYEAICQTVDFVAGSAPAGKRRAVVAFTDGRNDTNPVNDSCVDIDDAIAASQTKGVDLFTIGLSGDVDGEALATLADGGNGVFLFAEDTAQLITIYGSLGNLLSGSLTTYTMRFRVTTAVANTFQVGRGVLGEVTVNTGATDVTLPFVARIFAP
jgi:PKD repeat protein